jgi:hypothetical protein
LIAGVLIAQNSDRAAIAQQLERFLKTFSAVEHFDPGPSTQFSHMFVNEAVAKSLIDCAVSDVADKSWQDLRAEFPVAEMTQDQHNRTPGAQVSMYDIQIFDLNMPLYFLERRYPEFNAAQKVRA